MQLRVGNLRPPRIGRVTPPGASCPPASPQRVLQGGRLRPVGTQRPVSSRTRRPPSPAPRPPVPAALRTVSHEWQERTSRHFSTARRTPLRGLLSPTFVRHCAVLSYLTTLLLKVKPPESVSTPGLRRKAGAAVRRAGTEGQEHFSVSTGPPSGLATTPRSARSKTDTEDKVTCGQES